MFCVKVVAIVAIVNSVNYLVWWVMVCVCICLYVDMECVCIFSYIVFKVNFWYACAGCWKETLIDVYCVIVR